MRTKRIAVALIEYTVMSVGQVLIGWGVQQGTAKVLDTVDKRKRAKNRVGFRP